MSPPDVKKLKPQFVLAGVILLLYGLNWQAVQWGYSPFLYCWLRPVGGWFLGWLNIANLVVLAYFAYSCTTKSTWNIVKAGGMVVLVYGLPVYVDTILRLDGSC